ncbi:MAG: hypothetical protein RJA13_696 [Bacteroidota bacterium]|jgi:ligand-binding sensor domain-containing protein
MFSRIFLVFIWSLVSLNQAMALTISHGTLTAEIFTNRNSIQSLLLSENKKILWVGTNGGLEKRDAQSGELLRVLTNKDNLPSNNITTLQNDISGGIWIGTMNGEIIYYDTNEKLTTFNKKNSKLSGTPICSLLNDGKGGVWIGEGTGTKSDTMLEETGLVHIQHDGKSAVFNSFNSDLYGAISGLSKDSDGNIWVGTNGGLSHYNINNANWETITKENGKLPSGNIGDLVSDKNGGLWIASGGGTCGSSYTYGGETASGLIYKNPNNEFVIFNKENSNLPDNYIQKLLLGTNGDIWMVVTGNNDGKVFLVHRTFDNQWSVFNEGYILSLSHDGDNGLWVGTPNGLVHFTSDQKLIKINDNIMGLPSNEVTSILNRNGEILVGTDNGLFYKKQNKVEKFDLTNSPLPSDIINCLSSDTSQDDVWIGTNNGLARYSISNGQWLIFNTINSPYLLNNNILSLFTSKNGVWIGTENGLVFRSHTGEWTTLLSNEYIKTIYIDNKNSIWVSTGSRLLYKTSENIWLKFSATNSSLPSNMVTSIAGDTKGGIFIGTYRGGLVYIDNNKWQIFNKDNSKLPDNDIRSLAADRQGGVWIGTDKSGLVYYNNGQWITFNKANSQLLGDHIWSLSSDEQGIAFSMSDGELQGNYLVNIVGLGAGRFLFNNKTISSKIAIIIAGGGNENSNTLWDTTYSISNSIYSTLSKAKFNSDEIYYLSPVEWADFNGDGINDRIVDAPKANRGLEAGDIQKALEWALERGKLDQPLYIFFVDHGGTDKLQLSKDNALPVEQFKQMLDDYQAMTGNEIVLVIDACFSGVLGEKLKADKRSIITSTSNSYAYFNRLDKQGFSTFLTKGLSKGMNFNEAFSYATTEQTKLLNKMDLRVVVTGSTGSNSGVIEQTPRKFDGNQTYSLDKLFLNGSFVTGDATLSVKNITTSTQIKANIPFNLKAQASVAQGDVRQVWAVVRPPRMDLILDSYNTPILAFPRVILSSTNVNNEWEGTLSNTRYNGDYKITFYAKDRDGDVVSSDETITLTVSDGIEPPPQATLQIQLNQTSYKAGDLLKATITEELQWGYDLYVAVILPSGDFITLKGKNGFSNLNEIKTWYGNRQQGITNPFLELTLPALPVGQYCLFGALSPEGEPPLNATNYWKQTTQCFVFE